MAFQNGFSASNSIVFVKGRLSIMLHMWDEGETSVHEACKLNDYIVWLLKKWRLYFEWTRWRTHFILLHIYL